MDHASIHSPVADLVDRQPAAADLLMALGIDPRQHPHQSLAQLASNVGLDPDVFLDLVFADDAPHRDVPDRDWEEASLDALVDHIIATHHESLRRQLARLQLFLTKALRDHGQRRPELHTIGEAFQDLQQKLTYHVVAEEQVLFPRIRDLADAVRHRACFEGGLEPGVRGIRNESRHVAGVLDDLRQLTGSFRVPVDASTAYQSLIQELSDLDAEMQRHAYLENDILFVRALEAEQNVKRTVS